MAVALKELIDKVNNMDITQLSGFQSMDTPVSWVHMVETTQAADFLNGGEIAITTGTGLGGKETISRLIKTIYSRGAAGVFVNTGPFIEKIPKSAVDFCLNNDFPLFVIPWRVHLAELMRIFCCEITRDQHRIMELTAAFENAIFFPKQEELYIIPLSQQGFMADWKYAVCMLCIENCTADSLRRTEQVTASIGSYAGHKYSNFAVFCRGTEIIAVTADFTDDEVRRFVNDIHRHALRCLVPGEELTIGCGRLTKSIRCLYKSYSQARAIRKLQSNGKTDPSLIFYPDMGLFQILMGIEDREIVEEYYSRTIRPLAEYDEKNGSDLKSVLHSYLNHNGSVKDTAAELYVHRNTINYKLNKISDILGKDLSSLSSRLELTVGFMLEDML